MVLISVVICTFNRPFYLKKVLTSLCNQTIKNTDYEIVIVDSGNAYDTDGIVKNICMEITTHVFTARDTGLSDARNLGIRNSTGTIIAFLDDDALADPDWLEQILTTFGKGNPRICACGGKVDLLWEQERPGWIHDKMLTYLGRFDQGDKERLVPGLIGLNMAFDRRVFTAIGYFDPDLGRIDGNLLSGDEVEFFSRMRRHALTIWYNPRIHAMHHVTRERITKSFFYQRYYWQGRSDAILNRKEKNRLAIVFRLGSFLVFSPLFHIRQWMVYTRCVSQYFQGYFRQFFLKA